MNAGIYAEGRDGRSETSMDFRLSLLGFTEANSGLLSHPPPRTWTRTMCRVLRPPFPLSTLGDNCGCWSNRDHLRRPTPAAWCRGFLLEPSKPHLMVTDPPNKWNTTQAGAGKHLLLEQISCPHRQRTAPRARSSSLTGPIGARTACWRLMPMSGTLRWGRIWLAENLVAELLVTP